MVSPLIVSMEVQQQQHHNNATNKEEAVDELRTLEGKKFAPGVFVLLLHACSISGVPCFVVCVHAGSER